MSVWDDKDDNQYIIHYWGPSNIGWQQHNRQILNETIKIYNGYVLNNNTLEEVKISVYDAISRLENESGNYMDDINLMKTNVDEIEITRRSANE